MITNVQERRFTYNGMELPDPGPGLSVDAVRDLYSAQYPDLSTASISGPVMRDGYEDYAFTRAVGTKG